VRRLLSSLAVAGFLGLVGTSLAQQTDDPGVALAPSGYERVGSGPGSFFWIRDNLSGIVDTLAMSIAFIDDRGRIVGTRARLPEGFVVGEVQLRDASILLISGDRQSSIEIPRTVVPESPPVLTAQRVASPRSMPAPPSRRAPDHVSMEFPDASGARSQVDVRSLTGSSLADTAVIGTDRDGRRYVLWSEFVGADPDVVVRTFVGKYAPGGALIGIAEVPLADMDYVPDQFATITGAGELRVMVPRPTGVQIRTIPFQTISPSRSRSLERGASEDLLRRLSTEKGRTIRLKPALRLPPERIPSAAPSEGMPRAARSYAPITREEMLKAAAAFLQQEWLLSDKNFELPNVVNVCNKSAHQYWSRPSWIRKDFVGKTMKRVPYKWGGFDSPSVFVDRIKGGRLAGDVCTCRDPAHNDCIVDTAAGVDCSGFVSRAWGLASKLGTIGLGGISTKVTGWQTDIGKVKAGDALNKAGSHVRLVVDAISNPEIRIIVIESTTARSCMQRDGTVGLCEGVCECVRKISEFSGYQLLQFKGVKD